MDTTPPSEPQGPDSPNPDDDGSPKQRLRGVLVAAAIVAVAIVAGLAIWQSDSDTGGTTAQPSTVSDFAFLNEDGTTGTLADHRGQPLVVNFFASWCAPCRAELPDFEEVHVASGGDVVFLGISHDLDESSWRSFVDEVDITYTTVFQPEQEMFVALELFGMPSTAFVTADGEIVHTVSGLVNKETLRALIAEHLDVEV